MRPCSSHPKSRGEGTMSSVPQNQNAQHSNNMAAEIVTHEVPFKLGPAQPHGQTPMDSFDLATHNRTNNPRWLRCVVHPNHTTLPLLAPLHEPAWRYSVFEEHPNEGWIGSVDRLAATCAFPHALQGMGGSACASESAHHARQVEQRRRLRLVEPMKPTWAPEAR